MPGEAQTFDERVYSDSQINFSALFHCSHAEQLQLPLFALLLSSAFAGVYSLLSSAVAGVCSFVVISEGDLLLLLSFFSIEQQRRGASSNHPSQAEPLQGDLCPNQRLTPIPTSAKCWWKVTP
jgi:hypothetical protein